MKGRRLTYIRQIVKNMEVETQEEIAEQLRIRHNLVVTQATISRDIKELGLIKITVENGRSRYALPGIIGQVIPSLDKLKRALLDYLVSVESVGSLVVLRTMPGNAHSIAALLDAMGWEEVAGTIAGDDTILIIIGESHDALNFVNRIYEVME